jgi:hypothetical protein
MALSPLFTCRDCGDAIDPNQNSTYRLVRGWMKGSAKTVIVENEEWVYLHSWCFDTRHLNGNRQDTLF